MILDIDIKKYRFISIDKGGSYKYIFNNISADTIKYLVTINRYTYINIHIYLYIHLKHII